jgi:hypothetical protein
MQFTHTPRYEDMRGMCIIDGVDYEGTGPRVFLRILYPMGLYTEGDING